MSSAKKRKLNKAPESEERLTVGEGLETDSLETPSTEKPSEAAKPLSSETNPDLVDKNKERQERFKALQARAVGLAIQNLVAIRLTFVDSKNRPKQTSKKQPPNPSA